MLHFFPGCNWIPYLCLHFPSSCCVSSFWIDLFSFFHSPQESFNICWHFVADQDLWHGRAPVFQSCLLSTHLLNASHFFLLWLRRKRSQVMQRRVFPISRQFPSLCTLPTSTLLPGPWWWWDWQDCKPFTIHSVTRQTIIEVCRGMACNS